MNVVINKSVNQTLPRTVITAGATCLAVLALLPVRRRGAASRSAFAMLVGIITSTYSTVFIASAVAVLLSPARRQQGGAAPVARAEARPGRKTKGAKAS